MWGLLGDFRGLGQRFGGQSRIQTNSDRTDKAQTVQTDRVWTDGVRMDRAQTDSIQTGRLQTDRAQTFIANRVLQFSMFCRVILPKLS